ncbi:hypothetical protein [Tessaracoccus sp.]
MTEVHGHPHHGSENPGGHSREVPEEIPEEGSGNPGPNLGGVEEIPAQGSENPGPNIEGIAEEIPEHGSQNPGPELI